MTDILREAMKGWRTAAGPEDPPLKFETDGTSFTFIGYTPSEIADLFAALREHMSLQLDLMERAQRAQTSGDAVRYRPDSDGFPGGLDDARATDV
jgi:hypothetical protein